MAEPKITTGYTQPGTKLIVKPDIAKYTDKNGKVSAKYQTGLTNFYAKSTDPEAVKYRTDELTKKYGSLKDADGKTIFTPTYIKALAEGIEPPASLDKAVTDWATAKMKEATNYDWKSFSGGIGSVAAQNLLRSFVKDPSQVDTALTFKSSGADVTPSTVTGGEGTDTVPNEGITALEPYSGSISEVNTPEKMKQVVDNYDPNKGVYRAPSLDASGKLVATSTSPYSNILNGMLSGYKNPYAADYTNQLKMPETPDLTNIKKSFENNPTSKDLLKLANTAGQPYDPKAITSLSPALSKIYQPSITNSAGKATKPGAPDTTNTTLPVVPKAGEPIVTGGTTGGTTGGYATLADWHKAVSAAENLMTGSPTQANKDAYSAILAARPNIVSDPQGIANLDPYALSNMDPNAFKDPNRYKGTFLQADIDALDKTKNVTPPVVGPPVVNPPVKTAAELAAEKAEADRLAEVNRLAAEKAEAERQAGIKTLAEKAEADRLAAEKAEADRLAALGRNPDGGPSSLAPINPNTYGPQQVTLDPNTVVSSPSGINALSAQTVALPPSGPQPINPSNGGPSSATVGPITAAQRDLGPLNISNLGAVISPQAMNSTAGGVASLVGPQVTVQPQPAAGTGTVLAPSPSQSQQTIQPSAVVQQPAPISATARNNALLANIAAAMKKK